MPLIACPSCGEDEQLLGTRRPDDTLEVTCGSCGAIWQRGGPRRCSLCGSQDLAYTPRPLWEKARGNQRTPVGRIDAYSCYQCGGRDVTSADPRPGPPDHVASRPAGG